MNGYESQITNIRYAADDDYKIEFDFCGKTIRINNPSDVLLVGFSGAAAWIAKRYWFLLAQVTK